MSATKRHQLSSLVGSDICVFMKGLTVLIEKLYAEFRPDQTVFHFLLYHLFHAPLQIIRKILNDRQDLLDGCSLDHFFDEIVIGLLGVRVNVNLGNPAEKVMNIPEYVLICAHQ